MGMTQKKPDPSSRRRKERAFVGTRLQGVFVRCEALAPGAELRVFNISELGVGVDAQLAAADAPGAGAVLDGKLLVGRTVAPVKLRVVHRGREMIGLEFLDPSALLRGAIQKYFEPELAGASLRPVPDSTERKRLFASRSGDRLEIELAETGAIARFAIQVLGNSVEWDGARGFELKQNAQSEPVPEFLRKQLVKLAESATAVDADVRAKLEAILKGAAAA